MIFSCGLTQEEQDRRDKEWHPFFPLFPRTIAKKDGKHICAWLQTIERRAAFIHYYEGRWVGWEYRSADIRDEDRR